MVFETQILLAMTELDGSDKLFAEKMATMFLLIGYIKNYVAASTCMGSGSPSTSQN